MAYLHHRQVMGQRRHTNYRKREWITVRQAIRWEPEAEFLLPEFEK